MREAAEVVHLQLNLMAFLSLPTSVFPDSSQMLAFLIYVIVTLTDAHVMGMCNECAHVCVYACVLVVCFFYLCVCVCL